MASKSFTYKDFASEEYAESKRYWRRRNRYYHNSIAAFIKFVVPSGSKVLEIGCGTGETLASLEKSECTGLEINPFMSAEGKAVHKEIEFATA
ncbi:MAG: glycosyl transferase, partial [Bacteroidetes bacterium]|nr:glycosyl transferase [Bacteroidota bacterium]